jgi:DNA modification methylase/superfamily II DNA or RNA helicase
MSDYAAFLAERMTVDHGDGFTVDEADINPQLFDFQRAIVAWACEKGRSAIFADCGLGKTPMQLEWARLVCERHGGIVLIVAPLAVAQQTAREGEKFGIPVNVCRTGEDVTLGVNITNYEMLRHFTPDALAGLVLDESSILKSYDGKTRTEIIAFAERIPFRLACTATPAPNDPAELCNHAEFLGVMTESEVKALYFTTDGTTTRWRLKGHSHEAFYRWMASWAVAMRKPSDLGFPDGRFELPPMEVHEVVVEGVNITPDALFTSERIDMNERRKARQASIDARVRAAANLANATDEPFICWCDLNAESDALTRAIPDAVEVRGSQTPQEKADRLLSFVNGTKRVLVTKPSVAGFGLNMQHCNQMAFVGLSDSYEQFYQALRRCWRFGQEKPVDAYIVTSDAEGAVVQNVKRKEREAIATMAQIVKFTRDAVAGRNTRQEAEYREDVDEGGAWTMHLGDCVEVTKRIPTESVDLSVFSPPFPGMYTYSNSVRDIGNAKGIDDLMEHFGYLAPQLLRVTKPGRSCFVHLTQYVAHINSDGFAGLKDFRGRTIGMMEEAGWRYYGEITIDKNPQVKAIRTKDRGLLFKTLATDSSMMHVALPDWVLHFRKDGVNPAPIRAGLSDKYGNTDGWITQEEWIRWARPIWYAQDWAPDGDGISETDVLNVAVARDSADERHICPLQLPVTERIVKLWSAPGEVVFSPFAGIGSEGHEAVRLGRRFVGIELKESYWKTACRNLRDAEAMLDHQSLFSGALE